MITSLFNLIGQLGDTAGGKNLRYYPLFLDILGKKCVVVGGGEVAARKVTRLLECGAKVVVVSPKLTPELARLKTEGAIEYFAALYNIQYLEGAVLIIGATDDENTNAAISSDAGRLGIPVNIVDDPQKCTFILPSIMERGDLTFAVSTGGNSPALARYLREELEARYGVEYASLLDILGQLRGKMEKNAGIGTVWFEKLLTAGLMEAIRIRDAGAVRKIVRDITGEEVHID
jgi:precorrin-2 dehydrogenase/sirohydrochlorin ferrochelatase